MVLMQIVKCNTMAVNVDLYVKSVDEFAYLTKEMLHEAVCERDTKTGKFLFPALIRCCNLLLLAAACCCLRDTCQLLWFAL